MSVMKDICYEERPDYLRNMFENFFRYAKYNHNQIHHNQIPFELLVDAIGGGLSGANFPEVNRTELLQILIDNCKLFEEAAKRTLELRQPITVKAAEEPEPTRKINQKTFLNLDEVCERFLLPKSNIKSKKWRDEHDFPSRQTALRGTVIYKADEIEKWLAQHQMQ